jgi:hypothetical protein
MAKKRTILVLIVCFSLTVFAGQSRRHIPKIPPKPLQGMTPEERRKMIEQWRAQIRQQELKRSEERMMLMARQAWKRLLRVNDRQWKLIEPKYEKVQALSSEARVCALGWEGRDEQNFHWHRHSKGTGLVSAKSLDEMTEGQRIADKLADLLENKKSKDEDIRLKIDALQQAREKARKALPKALRELAAVLTIPRQEAVFLLMGHID